MRGMSPLAFAAALALLLSSFCFAEPVDSLYPSGFVNDYAGVLDSSQKAALEQKLSAFEENSTVEIAVVTVNNLDGDYIEHYAVELFEKWGIGKKAADNGVLLLVAKGERQVRIEVGYGLEEKLTDGRAKRIISQAIAPHFENGEYYAGLDEATGAIIGYAEGGKPAGETAEETLFVLYSLLIPFLFFGVFLFGLGLKIASVKVRQSEPSALERALSAGAVILICVTFFPLFFLLFAIHWFLGGLGVLGALAIVYAAWKWGGSGMERGVFAGGGGGWRGGGGGFGGFGGGRSGGGGASGGW